MPSGKKARGRKNRAKKEAILTAHLRMMWEPRLLRDSGGAKNAATSSCEHMIAILPRIPRDGPAVSFMNCLAGEAFFDRAKYHAGNPVEYFFSSAVRCFPEVREEESERSLAINLLLHFVRNVFVHDAGVKGENWFHQRHQNEVAICIMVSVLELCGTYSDMSVARRRASKMSNKLVFGNHRDVVKFVAKRLPCTCLKKLHSVARKKFAKMGKCWCCRKRFPRSQLHVCTGCMIIEYCSKACQRADWSRHKRHCGNPEVMSRDLPADYVFRGQY